jgi:hypothetical protein
MIFGNGLAARIDQNRRAEPQPDRKSHDSGSGLILKKVVEFEDSGEDLYHDPRLISCFDWSSRYALS